jgi:hypothetical protein
MHCEEIDSKLQAVVVLDDPRKRTGCYLCKFPILADELYQEDESGSKVESRTPIGLSRRYY